MKEGSKVIIGIFIVILACIAVNEVRSFENRSSSSPREPAKECAVDNQKVIVVIDGVELAIPRKKIGYVMLNPISSGNGERIRYLERKCNIKRIENALLVHGTRYQYSRSTNKPINILPLRFKDISPENLTNGMILYDNKRGDTYYFLPSGAVKTKKYRAKISCNMNLGKFGYCNGRYFHPSGLVLAFNFSKTNSSESDFIPVAIKKGQELEAMIVKNLSRSF